MVDTLRLKNINGKELALKGAPEAVKRKLNFDGGSDGEQSTSAGSGAGSNTTFE